MSRLGTSGLGVQETEQQEQQGHAANLPLAPIAGDTPTGLSLVGTFPGFIVEQLAALHKQEQAVIQTKMALLRVFFAGKGHDFTQMEQVSPISLETGAYAYRDRMITQRDPSSPSPALPDGSHGPSGSVMKK